MAATSTYETYEFRVGPEYTVATYYQGKHCITLEECVGMPWEKFHTAMMKKLGMQHRQETETICGRTITTHTYTR